MENLFNFFKKDNIGEPPWNYYFLQNLDEKEYPRYLAKLFKIKTGENLPLKKENGRLVIDKKKCKTFNQKIQWIKLHGVTDLMRTCTDKVAVRDYVKEKIGEEYLKPVLQIIPNENKEVSCHCEEQQFESDEAIQKEQSQKAMNGNCGNTQQDNQLDCHGSNEPRSDRKAFDKNDVTTYFDQIDFNKLPNAFVMKCNHGCKWQYIIKNKEEYLNTPKLMEITKQQMTGWLEQEFCWWGGFEMQYKGIKPKILIEPLMREDINKNCEEIHVYCFCGTPKLILRIEEGTNNKTTLYDEKLNICDDVLSIGDEKVNKPIDDNLKNAFELSKVLSKDFNFVRVDWMIFQNKFHFEELTFTPYSGFHDSNKNFNKSFGKFI